MKRFILVALAMFSLVGATARGELFLDAGVKLWYAEPKVTDRAVMFGPSAVLSLDDTFWLRGFFLFGNYSYIQQREPRRVQDFTIYDSEIAAGMNWDIFHFGLGLRAMSVVIERSGRDGRRVDRPDAMGPALILGASQSFSEWPWGFTGSPWGWYAGASWMFHDFEDDDGEHINFEAGITHVSHNLYKSIGYRFKYTSAHERMEGFTATLMFAF